MEVIRVVAKALSHDLHLTLLGIDIVVEAGTGQASYRLAHHHVCIQAGCILFIPKFMSLPSARHLPLAACLCMLAGSTCLCVPWQPMRQLGPMVEMVVHVILILGESHSSSADGLA